MTGDFLPLIGRIQQSLEDLDAIVYRADTLIDKYQTSLDDGYLDGVALNLHTFYSAIHFNPFAPSAVPDPCPPSS